MSKKTSVKQFPIRILHVIGIMNRGGAETMIMNLYRNIDRSKIQFDFVENTDQKGVFEEEIKDLGGRVYHCPHFKGINITKYKKWWDAFFVKHKDEYTIVHGHIGSTAAIYLFSAKQHGLKTIAHSHNSYTENNYRQSLYKIMSYPTRNIADYFFACSESAGLSRFGKLVRFTVLKNAIDTRQFEYIQNSVFPNADGKIVYGHIGRFSEQKNHQFLIDVYYEIHKKQTNSVLLLVGEGPLRGEIEKKVNRLSLEENVYFLGVREDIPVLLSCMNLLLFPSKYEGLPVTLVEAQTSGLRCLISDVISDETVIISELITKMSLKQTASEWAEKSIGLTQYKRQSYRKEVTETGFDIQKNAEWLQEFYLKEATKND